MDGSKKNGKGFAYILFTQPEDAINAHKAMDGSIFQGRLLHILPAAPKRENKLDQFAISKLPLKQQRQLRRKADAATLSFNWNSLFMNVRPVSLQPFLFPDLLMAVDGRCHVLHIIPPWR
jgi:multiple RNA-binding domain-containing protein 1